MKYTDLRDFISELEKRGELVRIKTEVDPNLEMTEIADRTLRAGGRDVAVTCRVARGARERYASILIDPP